METEIFVFGTNFRVRILFWGATVYYYLPRG